MKKNKKKQIKKRVKNKMKKFDMFMIYSYFVVLILLFII